MRKFSALLLILCLITGITACGGSKTKIETKEDVKLYFLEKDTSKLVTEDAQVINSKGIEDSVGQVMTLLLAGPKNAENRKVVREGAQLIASGVGEEGNASVNLSKEFYNEKGIDDILAATSIVKSLCSLSGVRSVIILVEGKPIVGPSGEKLGYLTEDDLVFDITASSQNEVNVTLYFSDSEALHFLRETRRIKAPTGESVEKLIVSELIKGPKGSGAVKTIPVETKIRSVETKDGVCFVNLSNEFLTKHSGGTAGEYMTVYSIVNSLTELSNVDKVQFLIEGEKKDVFIHFTFNEPFERDVSMIKK